MKPNPKNHLARSITAACTAAFFTHFAAPSAQAVALTWDTTIAADATITAGSETWANGAGNWNDGATSVGVNWSNATPDTAKFQADDDLGAHVITVGGSITTGAGAVTALAGGMAFANSGYTLSATSAQTITVGTGTATAYIDVASGKTATIGNNATIAKGGTSGGLFLLGGGTLKIDSGAAYGSTFTTACSVAEASTLWINGGTASFAGSLSIGKVATANPEGGSGNLTVDSGSLTIGGTGNLAVGRTNGDTCLATLNNGTITAAGGNLAYGLTTLTGTGSFHLNGGTLTVKSVTSTVNVTSFFSFNGGTLKAATSATGATFMTGIDTARIRNGAAVIDTNGQAITIGQVLTHSLVGGDNSIDGGLTLNDSNGTPGALSLTGANTFNGPTKITAGILSLENSLAIQSSALDTLNSVTGNAGNGLKTALAALTIGGLTGNKNLAAVFTTTSGGYSGVTALTLNLGSGLTYSYSGDIVNGAMTLAKSGAGAQILTGANTHDSLTTISAGALIAAANNALGTTTAGTTVSPGASLGLSGGIDYTTTETVTGSGIGSGVITGTIPVASRGLIQSVSGNNIFRGDIVVDAGGVSRFGTQDGASLTLTGTITQATGNILFRAGNGPLLPTPNTGGDFVTLSNAGNSFGADSTVFTNASTGYSGVRLGITNALPAGLTISGLGGGTPTAAGTALDLNAFNQSLNGLIGTAPLNIINTNTVTPSTLTLNPTADKSTAGTLILGGTGLTGTLGTIHVIKEGAFTQTLAGVNTYTGTTTINDGTLLVNSPGSLATASAVTVNGGNLGGTGTVGGNVTVAAAGNLAPGASAGTLNISGNLDISAMAGGAGQLKYELDALAGTNDLLAVGGTLNIGTLALDDLAVTNLGGLEVGNYTLITSTGLSGTASGTTALIAAGFNGQLQVSGDNLILAVTAVGAGSAYDTWKAANAPGSDPDDDTDGDGVTNAVEFVLGGTSASNDLEKLPEIDTDGTNMTFTFERDQDSIDPGNTAVTIETSTDLAIWDTAPSPYAVPDVVTAGPPVAVVDNLDGTDTVTLTVSQGDAKKFARLKVVITP